MHIPISFSSHFELIAHHARGVPYQAQMSTCVMVVLVQYVLMEFLGSVQY